LHLFAARANTQPRKGTKGKQQRQVKEIKMNIFLIETETNHFANQIFSAWVKKTLPDWNLIKIESDSDNVIELVQVALTQNISKVIHLGNPTIGAIIQMSMAFSMGMPVYALGLPVDKQDAAFRGILEDWSYETEDFERSLKSILGKAA
jgi:hypothetical protein